MSVGHERRLELVPSKWAVEPTILLTELGERIGDIEIVYQEGSVRLPPEVQELVGDLEKVARDNFFNGPLAHVAQITRTDSGFRLSTLKTSFFGYLAASHHYGQEGTQEDNPVRPLAVQAVLLSPDNRFLFERRSQAVVDFPRACSFFGSALKPGQLDPKEAMKKILMRKWSVELGDARLVPTGLGLETVGNIVHLYWLGRLDQKQFRIIREQYGRERDEKLFYPPLTLENVETLLKYQNIRSWNPAAFDNLMAAIAASGLIDVGEVRRLRSENIGNLQQEPFVYQYPYASFVKRAES